MVYNTGHIEYSGFRVKRNATRVLYTGFNAKTKSGNPAYKFVNLALTLAKRTITMRWKAKKPPKTLEWYNEVVRWGRAEGAELQREEQRGLQKKPISLEWIVILEGFIATELPPQE